MPKITVYSSRMTPTTAGTGMVVSPPTEGSRAISEAGKAIFEIGAKFKRAREVTEYNDNMRELRQELTSLRFSFAQRSDFDNFQKDFQKEATRVAAKYAERLRDNALWPSFEPQLDSAILDSEIAVRNISRKKQIDFGRASFSTSIDQLAEEYGKATEREKENIIVQAQDMAQMNVDVGYISNQESQVAVKNFRYNALKSDAWHTARAMGAEEGLKWLQNPKNTPKLKREDRNSLIAELRRDWNIERVRKNEQERKINEMAYENFLEQLVAWENGETPLPPSHTEIMQSPITDPKWKQQLMAYIDAVGKERNPFLNSDPKIFGEVIAGLYLETSEWNKGRIFEYLGEGLSTQHVLFAVHELDRITKEPDPKKNSQLALGIQILGKALKEGMFIGKDLKEATDKEIIDNYSIHARAIASLVNRANTGEEALQVTREIMKPYVDRKIRAWYKNWISKVYEPSAWREEGLRDEAIQRLQEEGSLITEETIIETMKKMKGELGEEAEESLDEIIKEIQKEHDELMKEK